MMDDVVLKKATIGDLEAVQILNQKLFKREFERPKDKHCGKI